MTRVALYAATPRTTGARRQSRFSFDLPGAGARERWRIGEVTMTPASPARA